MKAYKITYKYIGVVNSQVVFANNEEGAEKFFGILKYPQVCAIRQIAYIDKSADIISGLYDGRNIVCWSDGAKQQVSGFFSRIVPQDVLDALIKFEYLSLKQEIPVKIYQISDKGKQHLNQSLSSDRCHLE